jgi:1-deoxy-D-xylulose-5-phosphate synthase
MDDALSGLPIGRAEVVCEGADLAILAIGSTVYPALNAADQLRQEGIHVRVVNARFVKPLDQALLIETARSLKIIITVEENVLMGGFGSAVLELLEQNGIHDVQVKRLGIDDEFVVHATQAELRSLYGIDEAGIIRAVRSTLERHKDQAG